MIVKWIRTRPDAIDPVRATDGAAGWDLSIRGGGSVYMPTTTAVSVDFGIAVEIPPGYFGLLTGRSSLAKVGVTCRLGVIDADYRGSLIGIFEPGPNVAPFLEGRVAQLVILARPDVTFVQAESLSQTARGAGGIGSTGR